MKLIDTHAHLDFPQFKNDLNLVVQNAQDKGISKVVNIGCDPQRARDAVQIAEQYENVWAAVGIHPDEKDEGFEVIEELSTHPKVVAIGECGLDFFTDGNPPLEAQEKLFLKHIQLAQKLNKPVVVHLRDAREEAWDFLSKHHDFPFVVHCYSEDLDFAEQIIDWGGLISFTGIVTFPNAKQVHEVAQKIPLNKMMLETDCPFLAPQKCRGQRCEPAHVYDIADRIAELRGLSLAEVAEITTKTAEEFFGI